MQLPQKPKTLSGFFIAFVKSTSNLENFLKKDEPHSLNISKNIDSERRGYLILEKVPFQNSLQ